MSETKEHLEILNAIYEVESHLLNNIESVRCMVRDLGTVELKECGPDITLRDFFAGCALARGVGGWLPSTGDQAEDIGYICRRAYEWAELMLKERDK